MQHIQDPVMHQHEPQVISSVIADPMCNYCKLYERCYVGTTDGITERTHVQYQSRKGSGGVRGAASRKEQTVARTLRYWDIYW